MKILKLGEIYWMSSRAHQEVHPQSDSNHFSSLHYADRMLETFCRSGMSV
jgi:hypothetical protein